MGHQHHWHDEPPEGKLFFNKTFDERYGDEEDMAHNSFWTSQEELQRLRILVEKDPEYESSPDWPMLVEWCTSCSVTRLVSLVLPRVDSEVKEELVESEVKEEVVEAVSDCKVEEVKVSCEAKAQDACTQTPRRKRRGGKGSRMRRLLAYQLMLSQKRGLPLSRLLTLKESETRSSKRKEQEESLLTSRNAKAEEKEVMVDLANVKLEGEGCFSMGASAGGSTIFTPRSSLPDGAVPTPDSFPLPTMTPSPHLSPPPYVWLPMQPYTTFFTPPPCGLMPGSQWMICGTCHSWGSVIVS